MQIVVAIILGIIQGITEFIPISSSGHLILADKLLGFKNAGLLFDVSLHLGTLLALLLIFGRDYFGLIRNLFNKNQKGKLARCLTIATIPALIAGFFLESKAETIFRSSNLVAIDLIVVALIMLAVERIFKAKSNLQNITFGQSIGIGIAQVFAILPGVSRSGSTIITGLIEGLDRVSAARFSFLLAGPVIAGAVMKVVFEGSHINQIEGSISIFIAGGVAAFLSGYLAIRFLLNYLSKHTLDIFAYYRLILGLIVLIK